MGGAGNYISSHARGGDNTFAAKGKEHLTDLVSDINREYESMKVFLDKFPCLKMLSDFEDQLEPYESLINPVDNKVMSHFLIPLTDLMVAANGYDVFTIDISTY
ncbi:20159_t:CDS:2, partial [Entrophospora sp. SA101]